MTASHSERFCISQKLAAAKHAVAQAVTDEFFLAHPEWAERDGDRGRRFCLADTCFHLEFLAGAIEAGSAEAFADYSRWTVGMLGSRGIAAHDLGEHLDLLGKHLARVLLAEEQAVVTDVLVWGRRACAGTGRVEEAPVENDDLHLTRQVFLAAILKGQRQAALNIVDEAFRAGHSHLDIYLDVFAESLHRIGELWERNKISVAQEHIATSIVQYAIAAIYPRMVPAPVDRGNMVVTGVAGEMHQIGGNLVADAMEAKGWKVRYLGTNLPHSSVLAAVEEHSAEVLCISTTLVATLPSAGELVRTVRAKLAGRSPKIILGGSAHRFAPGFAEDLGAAQAITDLRAGIDLLCA